jgi:hypothetical protein
MIRYLVRSRYKKCYLLEAKRTEPSVRLTCPGIAAKCLPQVNEPYSALVLKSVLFVQHIIFRVLLRVLCKEEVE